MTAPSPNRTTEGIILISLSVLAMSFADAVIKLFSADLTLWQIFVVRSVFAYPCFVLYAWRTGASLSPIRLGWVSLRSTLLVLSWIAYYAALPVMDFAVAAVAVYTNPIITALLSALVLKNRVTPQQWLGVFLGFLGVIAILRPGSDDFSPIIVLPLLAAVFYATAAVLTYAKCRDEDPTAVALSLHQAFILFGLLGTIGVLALGLSPGQQQSYPFLLGDWGQMTTATWATFVFLGVLSAAYVLGVARAYIIAPPQIIATFDYTYLVGAALWGFLLFTETPDTFTLAGMALITIAGILVSPSRRRGRPI